MGNMRVPTEGPFSGSGCPDDRAPELLNHQCTTPTSPLAKGDAVAQEQRDLTRDG